MGKYRQEASRLLELVGGKENIAAASHCVTRMRFVLNDPGKADIKGIEAIKLVKGTFTQAGQFQVIIGNAVSEFYKDFAAVSGVDGMSKDQIKNAAKQNQSLIQRLMAGLAEIFAPLIPALITGGLILGFRNCIDSLYLFENGSKTLCDLSQFWAGLDGFLCLIGEAVFYMLPVGICWSVTKKMGGTQMLGIVLGLTLVSGQLMSAYDAASAAAAEIPFWDFGAFHVNKIGYQSQVIPAILAAFTLVYLERFFRRISPQVISMIVVPFFSLLLAVIAAHFVLGPIGWRIGSAISSVVYAGVTGPFKVVFAAVFGLLYAPLVITGLHHMTTAIDMQLIADFGGTMLWPMIALSNIAQASAVLGMSFLQRRNAAAQEVNIPSCISCYLGVTEPAMFGVNLKYMFPFVCGMIGSACAAMLCLATGTTANAIGVGGLPGILSIKPVYMGSFALSMGTAIAIPFALTCIVGVKKLSAADTGAVVSAAGKASAEAAPAEQSVSAVGESAAADIVSAAEPSASAAGAAAAGVASPADKTAESGSALSLSAFLSGRVIPISEVPDQVFSQQTLGDGLAIEPAEDESVLLAPADGEITMVSEETRHACGITLTNGVEILLHIGLDTVAMNGDGFTAFVKEGDRVKRGDKLISFDQEKIKAAGHPRVTVMVITDDNELPAVFRTGTAVKAGRDTVADIGE